MHAYNKKKKSIKNMESILAEILISFLLMLVMSVSWGVHAVAEWAIYPAELQQNAVMNITYLCQFKNFGKRIMQWHFIVCLYEYTANSIWAIYNIHIAFLY